ncbi:MAG: hypothetical protein QOG18_201 [Microbacteriaceae bacterium]|nr:hypothetical protein [Microbacteriaceae bacterium]
MSISSIGSRPVYTPLPRQAPAATAAVPASVGVDKDNDGDSK